MRAIGRAERCAAVSVAVDEAEEEDLASARGRGVGLGGAGRRGARAGVRWVEVDGSRRVLNGGGGSCDGTESVLERMCGWDSGRGRTSSSLLLAAGSTSVLRLERPSPTFLPSPPPVLLGVAVPALELDGMGDKAVPRDVATLTGRFLGVGSLRRWAEESVSREGVGQGANEADALDEHAVKLFHVLGQPPSGHLDVLVVGARRDDLLLLLLAPRVLPGRPRARSRRLGRCTRRRGQVVVLARR